MLLPYTCDICSNNSYTKPFDDGSFAVLECTKCKYGKIAPIPSNEALTLLYNSKEYFATHMAYDYEQLTNEHIEEIIEDTYKLHKSHLANYLKNTKSLLEIGPGGGFSLKAFERKGLAVKGVETSSSSVKFARERLQLAVSHSGLEDYTDTQQYDIVMLNHVLEHFVDLHKVMQILNSLVNNAGLLYVRVPDHDSYDRKVFSDKWPAYLPFHISYFSEQSLRILLNTHGFQVLEVKKYISEKFMEGFPSFMRKLTKKIITQASLTEKFSGRTITIIARKK